MRITKRTLEEAVLAVLYAKSLEHPLWINASEVYWSLPFAEVSEREVTTMLTELVEEQRVKLYLGKYQLSKEEQIRLKEREQEAQKVRILDQGIKYDDVEKSHQEKLFPSCGKFGVHTRKPNPSTRETSITGLPFGTYLGTFVCYQWTSLLQSDAY